MLSSRGCDVEDENAILETSTEKRYSKDHSFRKTPGTRE
jgi:hypothetical protein